MGPILLVHNENIAHVMPHVTVVEFWGLPPCILFFNTQLIDLGGLFCQLNVTEQGSLVTTI